MWPYPSTKKGIGKTLLNHTEPMSHELTLWTFVANKNAQKFYKSVRLSKVERSDGAGNDKTLPEIQFYLTQE